MELREYHKNKMKHYKGLLAIVAVVLFLYNGTVTADTQTDEEKTITSAQKLIKASVKIEPDYLEGGSGFYISPNEIITNEHVIHKASSEVKIKYKNGQYCVGTVGYREEGVDLAIIHTDCTNSTYLTFNTVAEEGQTVLVMGNPQFFDFTLTKGIVSGWWRELLQVDAKINYGSSGGAVTNVKGEVIGVISKRAKELDYIGLAIPANKVKQFIERGK